MNIIKLDATDSTNAYLKGLMLVQNLEDFTVVMAKKQLNGRGQMGTKWESEPGKNLTFSVLKNKIELPIQNQFVISICVSLAIYNTLHKLQIPKLHVKWPNDIMSGNCKICGILIENTLIGDTIDSSIIGIGLNVNQTVFNNLPNVSSLKLLLGKTVNLEELLHSVVSNLQDVFQQQQTEAQINLFDRYESVMFKRHKPATFKYNSGELFTGYIQGVSESGQLRILVEDEIIKEFSLKEVTLLY